LPNRSAQRGDLYVVTSVQVPSQVSAEERELWQQLAGKSAFNPRGGA
jgi:DnaJ-class molecular chaperone